MPTRRDFLRDGAALCVAFLVAGCTRNSKQPKLLPAHAVFGDRIDAGSIEKVQAKIADGHTPYYVPEARAYVSPFPVERVDAAHGAYPDDIIPVLEAGLIVLYQRCTHLGCRVPWCSSSEWFECPCHDAKFDRVGEYRQGPAPRGMDLMAASIEQGRLVIDTRTIHPGVAIGANTTHQAPAGPFCV